MQCLIEVFKGKQMGHYVKEFGKNQQLYTMSDN